MSEVETIHGFAVSEVEGSCDRCGKPTMLRVLSLNDKPVYRAIYCDDCVDVLDREEEVKQQEDRAEELLERSGRTKRLELMTFEKHPNQGAVKLCQRWLDDYLVEGERRNLILVGEVGVGKTGLAWPLVRALCQHRVPAAFANVRDLLTEIRSAMKTEEGADTIPERLERISVACLDDLGGERPTDWARDRLATIIERRYQEQLPTIVTTNYDMNKLAERLGHDDLVIGQRIVSRLQEDAQIVQITGEDQRRKGRPAA